jgi:hypothetical protein
MGPDILGLLMLCNKLLLELSAEDLPNEGGSMAVVLSYLDRLFNLAIPLHHIWGGKELHGNRTGPHGSRHSRASHAL